MDGSLAKTSTYNCIVAGMLGATSSAIGKLASTITFFTNVYLLRASSLALYIGMVVLNWKAWGVYVRGMEGLPSLQASVISSSTNSLVMGGMAWLFFEESLSLKWAVGMAFMLFGVFLMTRASIGDKTDHHKSD